MIIGGYEKYYMLQSLSVYLTSLNLVLYIVHSVLFLKIMFYKSNQYNQMVNLHHNLDIQNVSVHLNVSQQVPAVHCKQIHTHRQTQKQKQNQT